MNWEGSIFWVAAEVAEDPQEVYSHLSVPVSRVFEAVVLTQ